MSLPYPLTLDEEFDYLVEDPDDFHERLHRLRARKPAAWVKSWGKPTLMFTSYALVDAAYRDEETFPSAAWYGRVVAKVLGRNMQCLYGQEHRRNRALVSPFFRARKIPGIVAPLLEPFAHDLIDRFEARGQVDLVQEFTKAYPIRVILEMMVA